MALAALWSGMIGSEPDMKPVLLVVDDEEAARYAIGRLFHSDFRIIEAGSVPEARQRLRTDPPDVILLDYDLPGENGLALLKELAPDPAAPAIILITAYGGERLAVEAMKSGAYDYLAKPYDIEELRLVVNRATERQSLKREVEHLRYARAGEGQFGRMTGGSPAMRQLFQTAERVAQSDLPVLIQGESGTGKDVLAQEIHARSPRSARRFVALNCSALPEHLVESELFGYEKGAFTGAASARAGKFEQAHHGTLFLDEIGDMAPATQAKILRAVENGAVERLGGVNTVSVNVRTISASNKDLPQAIRDGGFREDLYYRLAAVTLWIPPLRDRRDDIPALVDLFWRELRAKYSRSGPDMSREAIARLQDHTWPGNVRELRNALERAFVMAHGDSVTAADIQASAAPASSKSSTSLDEPDYREAKRLFEIEYLTRKLRENGGNVTRTAESIGMARQSLQEKIRELGLARP
ncbi:sigma-54-dependent transcriptional regulator [Paludibaculum fermentans]|uniref:Sigma-54-dependent Fis family transcriptional regulator n=1 Tax=Paludibaculum fermentans TaxID=1473598 RepID=A0A7S7SJA7_PALFE|nr:sigma-54 dependent transcriptional regulator [Paludibaculum fermentans]QOY86498.1 sigma-54-dependent Fis family transcriptional regulator [Paludibaculum fermentans]